MRNFDWVADESGDFRDEIDFRLEPDPVFTKPRTRPTREQVNVKKGMRLPCHLRAYLLLEILSTNKTSRAIARKFGVTPEAVAYHKARLIQVLRSRDAKILYRKDGSLFFG